MPEKYRRLNFLSMLNGVYYRVVSSDEPLQCLGLLLQYNDEGWVYEPQAKFVVLPDLKEIEQKLSLLNKVNY